MVIRPHDLAVEQPLVIHDCAEEALIVWQGSLCLGEVEHRGLEWMKQRVKLQRAANREILQARAVLEMNGSSPIFR